jgi:hypothetical protein
VLALLLLSPVALRSLSKTEHNLYDWLRVRDLSTLLYTQRTYNHIIHRPMSDKQQTSGSRKTVECSCTVVRILEP